ncbi:uncharacterized protein LOC104888495 isoform X1 [Beta vulgaris subsp. vulgaris]|uniref:uncharacterized protein LOC104888495 isoform X1 n=2 Tax=Beta vulgaris subsp. vulgaris TaxID=3555 RepID=UPI0020373B8A|nr:uncharacterized protein LOC104888495 isoform X1 [Beta vulgaris subsp. vulgaris]XP_010671801.2 uncharacterized protein LOC104888495 isoform X1 [Beta vulgaris subsp. vulgaris]XP_010671802.2 uncharacterized protein LOC104888495 isoform X1 [Beta vulgaris subsp. vulgaris]XP_048496934.1 uncharacterized protein LOC104888495 isoform X1 [Beta vulgaris subsp. vulgaris]XP_048496935.1 uncharacterized protein LOC104888495 isoform X1 [Beta vulgaris subsp. vulgaris]XP_048496936.1 uncharacterized protein L
MRLWNEWEIRALVLISLCLQLILIWLGKQRKRDRRKRIRYTLWLAYLSADWVATVALGSLSNANQQGDDTVNSSNILKALWAPILLLHLGGPDTITAYSMEDNALWLRHLLGLLVQVLVAFYIFVKSLRLTQLNYVAIPMFVSGIIKYGERTWALRSASSDHFRDSLLPRPDPGPNYAKFMEEYVLREAEGYNIQWTKMKDPKVVIRSLVTDGAKDCHIEAASTPRRAYEYFQIYKCLFADLILGFQELEMSKSFFLHGDWKKAFSVIEMELAFVFDSFYTKSAIHYTRWGRILRSLTLLSTFATLAAYYFSQKHQYSRVDVIITYILLVGAVSLEILGMIGWLCSDWALIWLDHHEKIPVKQIYKAISFLKLFGSESKWSNQMMQYNLISSCFEVESTKSCLFLPCYIYHKFKLKTEAEPTERVPDLLKKYIFEQLLEHTSDSKEDRTFCTSRGSWVLDRYQSQDLNWSVEKEFDQSILLWHIATDLCYHRDENLEPQSVAYVVCHVSKLLSNYILYLLVKQPFMLPNGIGKIRFQDTFAEAKDFIQERSIEDANTARQRLLNIKTIILPGDVKGDRSKSVLFDACRLAKYLQNRERKWQIIVGVWVEMLVYAASQCRSNHHAQQLAQGGELLTHVWLLLAHVGLSEHFRISEGHARVVLDVR